MTRLFLALSAILVFAATVAAYASGMSLSTTQEAAVKAKVIYLVKVTKVSKPKEPYSGTKAYPIEIEFELLETLKGAKPAKSKAIQVLPALQHKMPDGTVMGVWLKTFASGEEEKVTAGNQYLIYAESNGAATGAPNFYLMRIEPAAKQAELKKILNAEKQK